LMGSVEGHKEKDFLALDYGSMSAFNHECILKLIEKLEQQDNIISELQKTVDNLVKIVKNNT